MRSERPHRKLLVWQESRKLVKTIYQITQKFPDSERFGLISQLRRASVSVPTNISEGAARNTKKEFAQFLYISRGSLSEVDTLLTIAFDLEYLSETEYESVISHADKISAMLNGLIKNIKSQIKQAKTSLPHSLIT